MTNTKNWQIAYHNLTAEKLVGLISYLIVENDIPADSQVTFHNGYIVFQKSDGENIALEMVNNKYCVFVPSEQPQSQS
jgi:hypothetical protein